VENLFIINLDVLSSVLYGWRSLEATVRKTENQRQIEVIRRRRGGIKRRETAWRQGLRRCKKCLIST